MGHWTPRYAVNRAKWWWYERNNMDRPWLTPESAEILAGLILPGDIGIEWGSGRSTVWFARRMKRLTSMEDNQEWYEKVKATLARERVENADYHYAPPPGDGAVARDSDYVKIAESFADSSVGFALVDGSAREYCAQAIIPKIAPGGVMVIDNANWYFDHPTHSPASRYRLGHLNADWTKVAEMLGGWRAIWTSSGVTDTAIWIRPGHAVNHGAGS